jgi:hypothetical protein
MSLNARQLTDACMQTCLKVEHLTDARMHAWTLGSERTHACMHAWRWFFVLGSTIRKCWNSSFAGADSIKSWSSLLPLESEKNSPNKTTNSVATRVSPSGVPARTGSLEGRCLRNQHRSWTLLEVYDNLVFGECSRDCLLRWRRRLPTLCNDYAATTTTWPIRRVHPPPLLGICLYLLYLFTCSFFCQFFNMMFRCSSKFVEICMFGMCYIKIINLCICHHHVT